MSRIPLRQVAGRFYRAIRADRIVQVLDPPAPESAGRYHRPGQPALYLTPEADWAVIAIGKYMRQDGIPRVVVPLDLSEAFLVDQHDAAVCAALGIDPDRSNLPWQSELAAGREPPSWSAADAARAIRADGLIDRSRSITGGWHITLFRWNVDGAPTVTVAGEAIRADFDLARSRWERPGAGGE